MLYVTPKEENASIFTLKGSKHDTVKIYTTIEGENYFWTWSNTSELIKLMEERDGELSNQEFILKLDFGEHLLGLFVSTSGPEKAVKFNGTNIVVTGVRLGDATHVPFCKAAPTESTFMMLPPTDNSDGSYLSLNYIMNSLRFDDKKCLIKSDDVLDYLLLKEKDNERKISIHVASYCFCLLARSIFTEFEGNPKNYFQLLEALCEDFGEKTKEFKHKLKEINKKFPTKKGISSDEYKHFLKCLKKAFDTTDEDDVKCRAVRMFWVLVLDAIISKTPIEMDKLKEFFAKHRIELLSGEDILDYLGATNTILKSCSIRYQEANQHQESGHMTILRMMKNKMGTQHGNLMKQSLCVARHVSKDFNLEIIQDYSTRGTLCTKLDHHMENEVQVAKQFKNPCFLRILKRIQVDQCQKKDNHGVLACDCKTYMPDESDPYKLECKNCNHIHRTFESYHDLIGMKCLLILVNNGSMGDTFPPSLCGIDDRVNHVTIDSNEGAVPFLTHFAQEKGRLCRYTTLGSKLPTMYISLKLQELLSNSLKKDCSYYAYFVNKKSVDPKLRWNTTTYKFEPKKNHVDYLDDKKRRDHHLILIAEPQSGKTGAYLQVRTSVFSLLSAILGAISQDWVDRVHISKTLWGIQKSF